MLLELELLVDNRGGGGGLTSAFVLCSAAIALNCLPPNGAKRPFGAHCRKRTMLELVFQGVTFKIWSCYLNWILAKVEALLECQDPPRISEL